MDSETIRRWANPKTILVTTNLEDAAHLVPHAIAQAKIGGAHVLLVHVIEPSSLATTPSVDLTTILPNTILRSVQDRLNQIVKQFQRQGVLCEPITLTGNPSDQIEAIIIERDADRVIVGTRSARAVERLLLGSVAEDLVHSVDVPICILGPHVRPQIRPDRRPTSILFATSFHHESQLSAQLALELANLHQSRLTLLHVNCKRSGIEEERQPQFEEQKEKLLGLLSGDRKKMNLLVATIREGDPAEEILAEGRVLPADMIVLGTTGASKISRLLTTGVVHAVVAETRVPVITLRR